MAHDRPPTDLPCDGDGLCMICKTKPPQEETLTCNTCVTPWHVNCLSLPPQTLADTARWDCPDCSNLLPSTLPSAGSDHSSGLIAAIRAIESDPTLSDREKANKRQQLLSGTTADAAAAGSNHDQDTGGDTDVLQLLSGTFNCSFCMLLPERPVTTPCGHNFCLKCFEKWIGQGKRSCVICRSSIPTRMAKNPRINSSLVAAIRMAKMTKSNAASVQPKTYHFVHNQNRPDKAYTTERAKKAGKANAASGKIFVTCPSDYFGPIPADCDPRGRGVLVGETWEDRMECRQWGVHWPHVSGIAGQSEYGAQSVALSGGYEDDEDHGEWFLYTGSGGRDLSGNKRTNKTHSFDQKFVKYNEALRVSCRKGYPVRVVRSHKEKRSSYAPEKGVRYDGIYRIEKCWRKTGTQGFKVCRYLFVRCDNDPAPWTSDHHGDRPRPLPVIKEAKNALELTERKGAPAWDYDEAKGCWLWKIPPPESRKQGENEDGTVVKTPKKGRCKTTMMSVSERLLKEFCCLICRKVMVSPLTTPCAHNFCKACLEAAFAGQSFMNQRTCGGRRTLRAKKNIMKCPSCSNDISEYLQNPQVNRELMSVIETLQSQAKESEENTDSDEEMAEVDEKSEDASVEETATEVEEAEADAGNADTCTKTDGNLVEKNAKVSKPSPKTKPTRASKKKKKADDGDTIAEKPLQETATTEESAEANTELSDKKEAGVVDVGGKVKRTNKRKKEVAEVSLAPAKRGARTRSKKAKVETDD